MLCETERGRAQTQDCDPLQNESFQIKLRGCCVFNGIMLIFFFVNSLPILTKKSPSDRDHEKKIMNFFRKKRRKKNNGFKEYPVHQQGSARGGVMQ